MVVGSLIYRCKVEKLNGRWRQTFYGKLSGAQTKAAGWAVLQLNRSLNLYYFQHLQLGL